MGLGMRTAVAALALLAAGCDNAKAPGAAKTDVPATVSAIDTRPNLGVSLPTPAGWYRMTDDQSKALLDNGASVVSAGNDKMKTVLEASQPRMRSLFQVFQHPPGSPVERNIGIVGLGENITAAPGIQSGKDYFYQSKKLMTQQSAVKVEYIGDYGVRKIDGHNFDQMDLKMTGPTGVSVNETYYAQRHGNYAVMFIMSYLDDADRKKAEAVIDTIKLDW